MFFQNYSNNKLTTLNSSWLKRTIIHNFFIQINLSTTIGAIATTLLFSQNVLAESFRGYCISFEEDETIAEQAEEMLLESEPSVAIVVTKNNKKYTISLDEKNQKQLILEQEGEQIEIDRITLAPEGGKIRDVVLGQDDWLWIDRNAIDYIIKVNFVGETANFDPPIRLPELSDQPCHLFKNWFGKCRPGEYNYSYSLNRIFASGYPKQSWSKQSYIHSEFVAGEEKAVPEVLKEAMFVADIPQWKGVLFRNTAGEALFYDGNTVIDLSEDFLKLNNSENFLEWDVKKTASGRTFIGKFAQRTDEDALFLMELTDKPGFKPVYLPEDLNSGWLELFSLSEDPNSLLWILSRKVILSEVDRRIQTLVALPSFSTIQKLKIDELRELQESDESTIPFSVQQENSEITTKYVLRETPRDRSKCEVVLDINQPIILKEIEDN